MLFFLFNTIMKKKSIAGVRFLEFHVILNYDDEIINCCDLNNGETHLII